MQKPQRAELLRWGLLSTARINRSLIPPIRKSPRSLLLGVASRSAERAQAYAEKWGIPRVFPSYSDMIESPDIDVIYNALPNSMHMEWAVRAAQSGKHVLVEKPIALNVKEVDEISEAARDNRVVVMEAFMYRYHPQTLRARELIRSGAIGTLHTLRGVFTFTLDRAEDYRWEEEMGGGSLWDVGCYPVSMARYLVGEDPHTVLASQETFRGVDVHFAGILEFSGGVVAQIMSSFQEHHRAEFEASGSDGTLIIPQPFKPANDARLEIRRGEEEVEVIPIEGQDLYLGEVLGMEAAILDGEPPEVTLDESRGNVATIRALLDSAKIGAAVKTRDN